jgi:hypothetical protein
MKANRVFVGGVALAMIMAGSWQSSSAATLTLGYGPTGTSSGTGGGELKLYGIIDAVAVGASANYVAGVTSFGGNGNFETFCLEYHEEFTPGQSYSYAVSPNAIHGGNNVDDPVSAGTAYLYSLFAKGQLTGYNYGGNLSTSAQQTARESSARDLQLTIWYLEGENNTADPGTFDQLLKDAFGSVDNARTDGFISSVFGTVNAASFGVAAINLGDNDFQNQDQLIYSGGGYSPVPDGGTTLMLLGIGLGGVSLMRRKLA